MEAWRDREPYSLLVHNIPEFKTNLIATYTNLPHIYVRLSPFVRGYSFESNHKVDSVHDEMCETNGEDEIMMVLGYPFFPIGFS